MMSTTITCFLSIGWSNNIYTYGITFHFDIKDDKVWIQQNNTDIDIAEDLIKLGVSREDIVLGFYAPYHRPYTDFPTVS